MKSEINLEKKKYIKKFEPKMYVPIDIKWLTKMSTIAIFTLSLGGTARWLQLQPSSAWPQPTVSAFQYFRYCALTKPAVSRFLCRIYSLSKEEAF